MQGKVYLWMLKRWIPKGTSPKANSRGSKMICTKSKKLDCVFVVLEGQELQLVFC
jgi:hypothetical protein